MEITCYRDTELHREQRFLNAAIYNAAHVLRAHSKEGVVFVPIRSMQYLAVIDHEEIIFLDSQNKSWVEIAWQNFHPQQRSALTEPVPYEAVYYDREATKTMSRLLIDFPVALRSLVGKDTPAVTARVIKLDRKPD